MIRTCSRWFLDCGDGLVEWVGGHVVVVKSWVFAWPHKGFGGRGVPSGIAQAKHRNSQQESKLGPELAQPTPAGGPSPCNPPPRRQHHASCKRQCQQPPPKQTGGPTNAAGSRQPQAQRCTRVRARNARAPNKPAKWVKGSMRSLRNGCQTTAMRRRLVRPQ